MKYDNKILNVEYFFIFDFIDLYLYNMNLFRY